MVNPFHTHSRDIKQHKHTSPHSINGSRVPQCPKDLVLGAAMQSPLLLSQHNVLFDTQSCKKRPSALKEERGHPLSYAILNFLTVAAYARKDNPPGLEAVHQPGSPTMGSSREAVAWLPGLQAAAGRRSHLPVLLPKEDYKLKSNLLNL